MQNTLLKWGIHRTDYNIPSDGVFMRIMGPTVYHRLPTTTEVTGSRFFTFPKFYFLVDEVSKQKSLYTDMTRNLTENPLNENPVSYYKTTKPPLFLMFV